MLNALRRSAETRRLAGQLYTQIVARSRRPEFFTALQVPDTMDGRFDLLALHAWLALEALRNGNMGDLSQRLTDALFAGFDEALREQGAGDIGMPRRMKKFADAFYGRLEAYTAAETEAALRDAILRNVYRGEEQHAEAASDLAHYCWRARSHVAAEKLAAGELDFGSLPGTKQ